MVDQEEFDNRFTYHRPKEYQVSTYEQLRQDGRIFARAILDLTPESREQAIALTKLEEAIFWANAAIARNT